VIRRVRDSMDGWMFGLVNEGKVDCVDGFF
jgi:hypothetical protein